MKLVYLPETDKDLDRLYDFLIENATSLKTADKALLRIKQGVNALVHDPELGIDMEDDTGRRELTLSFGKGAYIVRYFLEYEYKKILILRIWHSKEDRD
ncbi:MAG: type II toxin-antitoxin system RelE/ParE family toxin [Pseudomonadales bacterium]